MTLRPSVLGKANATALQTLARNCIAGIVFDLIPLATGTNILGNDNTDIITIDFNIPGEIPALRETLENALVQNILATV